MTAPFLILLYVGGFQLMAAISAYRKVTVTTRSLADLTSRQEPMTDSKAIEFLHTAPPVIGNASCRERVCPYVSISVVRVSLHSTLSHYRYLVSEVMHYSLRITLR